MQKSLPSFEVLGRLDDLALEGGKNNDDGWGWTKLALAPLTPRKPEASVKLPVSLYAPEAVPLPGA